MNGAALEGAAFFLLLGVGSCADGLVETPGGLAVLLGGVAVSGLLVHLARSKARERERTLTRQIRIRVRIWAKKKAVEVVTTPQRQVKQSGKASISRPYFIGSEGDCQLEFQND